MRLPTPAFPRRAAIVGSASALLGGTLLACPTAHAAAYVATPRQTEGPYYPVDWSGDADGDLVQVQGEAARATGEILHLQGRVIDVTGAPLVGAQVEIWQCDAHGVYRHPRDESATRRHEQRFQGRGRILADGDGAYRFRTIRPVPYPGRTPHIHAKVAAPGRRTLITQFYLADEPLNARDGLFNGIRDARQRESLLMRPAPADRLEAGAQLARLDIVLS